jgi:PAS domain S-box-containing protein
MTPGLGTQATTPSILIVDDTPANLGVVVESLTDRGFTVLVAQDGLETLERAQFSRPDLILLDVKMPGIDGFETCRRLKRQEDTRDIPVIFMTALNSTEDLIEGFSAGGIDYVTKPVQIGEMLARVNTHLSLRAMHKEVVERNLQLSKEIATREQVEAALRRAQDELETRVAQRTRELAHTNMMLEMEIIERKRAEAALKASEAEFRSIVQSSPVPLVITSIAQGHVLYANHLFVELCGLDPNQVAGMDIRRIYADPRDRDILLERLERDGELKLPDTELCFVRPDGSSFWAWISARVGMFANAPAIYAGLYDATERRRVADKLRASEASLANAQRLAHLGDWEWMVDSGTMHWSDEVYRVLGLHPGECRPSPKTFLRAVHPEDRAAVEQALRELRDTRGPYSIDHRIVMADGSERILQFQAQIKTGGSGPPAGMVGTIQDITERKRIEHELLASREQLRQLSAYSEAVREEERKRIALEIHDELGQLLTALKMDVSLLRMQLDAQSPVLPKILEMRELVEKTISMVRNVANHLRPAALNFGIVSALDWLAEDFSRRNGIPCLLDVRGPEPNLPEPMATAVFRIVQESLTNVSRHADAASVEVVLDRSGTGLDLRVSDDGRGFQPVAARQGYSYGLLGMRERANLIGASLHIDSTPDKGTVVSIHVPLDHEPPL